jgi:hypothetical protein
MKSTKQLRFGPCLLLASLLAASAAQAADLGKAKATVDNIRQADPPQVSSGTRQSPVGVPTREFRPPSPSMRTVEPPSPVNRNNPTNDPDVQRGYDAHQRAHKK